MLKTSSNGDIYLTRGDSATLVISIENSDGTDYKLAETDILVLTLKKKTTDSKFIFQKQADENGAVVIEPEDTSSLPYGQYWYDCQLTTLEGIIQTVIPPSRFTVGEEVTW